MRWWHSLQVVGAVVVSAAASEARWRQHAAGADCDAGSAGESGAFSLLQLGVHLDSVPAANDAPAAAVAAEGTDALFLLDLVGGPRMGASAAERAEHRPNEVM